MTETRSPAGWLVGLAHEMRGWDKQKTWDALFVCHAANWSWERTLKHAVALLCREDSELRELVDAAAASRPLAKPGQLEAEAKAKAIAAADRAYGSYLEREADEP
jgi:hypothetical protein